MEKIAEKKAAKERYRQNEINNHAESIISLVGRQASELEITEEDLLESVVSLL